MSEIDPEFSKVLKTRRNQLINQGRNTVLQSFKALFGYLPNQFGDNIRELVETAYEVGLDTMADILQPEIASIPLSTADIVEAPARASVEVAEETKILAVNAVIRLLLLVRAESALADNRFDGQITIPRSEAVAMSAVVEAALGLDTSRLLPDTQLFDPRF